MSFAQALFTLMPLQAVAAALVLVTLIGWRGPQGGGGGGGRWAQAGMVGIAAGLALLSPSLAGWAGTPHALHSAGLGLTSAGLSALWWAVGHWLGPRAGRRTMAVLPLALAATHAGLVGHPDLAQTLADAMLAGQLAALGGALSSAGRGSVLQGLHSRRWRALGLAAVLPLMAALGGRAAATWFSPQALWPDVLLALASQWALLLALPMLLLAWRSQTEAELARLAQTDGLTGLVDAPAFVRRSVDLISMARRYDEPLALVLLELDDLPTLQAEHGPDFADRALALFGSGVQAQMRLGDLAGRVGEAQCGVLMARCLPEGPQALDRRLRAALAERAPGELGVQLSFSAGWAKLRPGDRGLPDLQQRAATALYEARRAGRGQLMAEPGVAD